MNISYQTLPNGNKYLWIDTQVLIKNFCKISKKDYDIKVSSEKFTRYLQDENVDEIWPELSKYNREFIKTGFTPKEQVAGLGNKGHVESLLINLTNPLETDMNQANTNINLQDNDGAIVRYGEDVDKLNEIEQDPNEIAEIVVPNSKQIHILGSKADIQGFKEFVNDSIEDNDSISLTSRKGISKLFNENPELANAVYEALGLNASELSMSSFMPKKHWRIGHIIDNPTEAANICDNTQIRVLTHIENTYGKTGVRGKIFGKPVIIWAKSPINDKQIHHHTVAIRLNDKVYLYDMPQSEFIKEISENKGEIVKEYTPRLIEYTHENLKKYYGTSNDNLAVQDEVILDNDILNLPTQITSQQKQQAQQIYSQYLDTIFPDSKVKDIVYHGTKSENKLEVFDENQIGALDAGYFGRGFYLTPDKQYASNYIGNKGTVWNEDVMKNKHWLLDNALRSILDASDFMMSVYNSSSQFDVTYKSEHQPLTIADRGAHNHITGYLRANTPYFVLSEECSDKYKSQITEHESFWLIDPLDGTKEFIKRNGEFAILISFIHKGEPIVGVMYFPVKDVVYYATNDVNYAFKIEKFKETTKIHGFNFALGNRTTVRIDKGQRHELILLTSRSHREPEMDDYIKSIIKKGYNVIEQGFGSSVKFEKMLNNEADIYARVVNKGKGPSQWDIAAAHCIIKAAGGEVLNLETRKELTYGGAELKLPSFIIKHPNLNV